MNPSAPTVLRRIADQTVSRLEDRKTRHPIDVLRKKAEAARRANPFLEAFTTDTISIIAEVKFGSPSRGAIRSEANAAKAVEVAGQYLESGARAISVLTEIDFFNGHLDYLRAIRAAHPDARLLLKDFVLDEYQILEAKVAGADAVLLIVSLLGESESSRLLRFIESEGLTALVEVHDESELAIAERIGARLIGVNNRNLKDLSVSLEVSDRLATLAKTGAVLVSESGIESSADLGRLRAIGYRGALVGTSLMRTPHAGEALRGLLKRARL